MVEEGNEKEEERQESRGGKDEASNTGNNKETGSWAWELATTRRQSGLAARHSSAQQRIQVCVQNTAVLPRFPKRQISLLQQHFLPLSFLREGIYFSNSESKGSIPLPGHIF